ncbi:efflux RND transporter periplasmic adaptor subunit [Rosistilla oblonga]|uniref:Macrolide export protein MacA n=1 Tax=Rosistilla oblonga TaxID=2527990 RepID=A0A518IM70_9BACT|nr:efflux RND transporter periplasmic adaptor subunit [Rosistilla oblonga]QDV54177.1 Macrolide export protein MacA [Rosistilla oblonga]
MHVPTLSSIVSPRAHCIGVAACLSLLMAATGCDSPAAAMKSEPKPEPLETIEAELMTVALQPWPTIVRSQGSLDADEESVVGAKVAGRVAEVHVDLGDYVNVGDPLVTLDQAEFQLKVDQTEAQLEQARAAVGLRAGVPVSELNPENAPPVRQQRALWEEAQSSLKRLESLRVQKAVSEGEYELAAAAERVAEARYASALNGVYEKIAAIGSYQAELSLARNQLTDAIIRSPLEGFIHQRLTAPGSYISVGQSIAVVVRTSPLRFRSSVPERRAQALSLGQQVRLQIESVPEPRTATITRISPMLDQQSRSLVFEAEIENEGQELRGGLFAEAEIVVDDDATGLVVPQSAINEFAGAEKAWKVVDGALVEQEVLIGKRRDGQLEVLKGLQSGDVILRDASQGRIAKIKP